MREPGSPESLTRRFTSIRAARITWIVTIWGLDPAPSVRMVRADTRIPRRFRRHCRSRSKDGFEYRSLTCAVDSVRYGDATVRKRFHDGPLTLADLGVADA